MYLSIYLSLPLSLSIYIYIYVYILCNSNEVEKAELEHKIVMAGRIVICNSDSNHKSNDNSHI